MTEILATKSDLERLARQIRLTERKRLLESGATVDDRNASEIERGILLGLAYISSVNAN